MVLWQDLRFALRTFIKTPAVTLAALLSIALGIAANTTVFTLVNAVLFRPMPVTNPEQLVALYTTDPSSYLPSAFSYPDYRDYRDNNSVFSDLFVHNGVSGSLNAGTGKAELIWMEMVSGNYFRALGLVPAAGRLLVPDDDPPGGGRAVAVLSYSFWQRRFGADPAIVGRSIRLSGHEYTVIGVVRAGFSGTRLAGFIPDIWVPVETLARLAPEAGALFESRGSASFNVNGRLKPGVTIEQAMTAIQTIADRLAQTYPQTNANKRVGMVPAGNKTQPAITLLGYIPIAATIMMGIVALVLVIACANVANLLLTRGSARRREIAMRLALGASGRRLARQLLTEGVLLATVGGALGLLLARASLRLAPAFNPRFDFATIDFDYDLALDYRILLFTAVASVLTGIVFGLLPTYQAAKTDLTATLQGHAARAGRGRDGRLQSALVAAQVATCLALLVGAGLFIKSLRNAQEFDPGFETKNILLTSANVGVIGYDEDRGRRFFTEAVERVERLPGVEAASMAGPLPLDAYNYGSEVSIEGYVPRYEHERISVGLSIVGDDYFATMKTPIVAGRSFVATDNASAPPVVIVNETMARRFWPGQNPIGKRLRVGDAATPYREVVGVAEDGKYVLLGEPPTEYLFVPHRQYYDGQMTVIVRTAGPPERLAAAVQHEIAALDGDVPLYGTKTMPQFLDRLLSMPGTVAVLATTFGVIALLMAAVGLYGVVGYSVAQRTREIGVRIALGAKRADVMRLVLGQAMVPVSIGVAAGLVAAFAVARFTAALLYGMSGTDPLTFATVTVLLIAVATGACYLPARRATRLNPLTALRYE